MISEWSLHSIISGSFIPDRAAREQIISNASINPFCDMIGSDIVNINEEISINSMFI